MCDDNCLSDLDDHGCGSGSCGKCRTVPLESGYDSGSSEGATINSEHQHDTTSQHDTDRASLELGENNFTPFYHLEKFLCPRFAKYSDAPTEGDLFTGGDGGVEIESCGWERQVFVERAPEVMSTSRILIQDFDDGTIQINDFVIEPNSDLGCGSFCSFKVASCTKDQGLYAIKTMSKRKAKKSAMLFRQSGNPFLNIERETAILKKISHPNVVKLFEIMDDPEEDMIYFVFEFMDRGSILSLPTDSPLKEVVAVRYFRDIICGIEYLHSKSIIHRDLKPENMLLNSFDRVKLIDFGLSFQYKNNDDTTRLPYGTPSFTAPECLDEQLEGGYSGRTMEIWALGVTLFSLLFGHVPYYDDNLFELYRIIQEEPIVFPTKIHISLNIRALLKSLLEKDAKKRIHLDEIMDTTLFISKNSPNYLPGRCKSCQYYTPSCHPVASVATLRQVV